MIKLIASDIDGTLVKESTTEIYPEMLKLISDLHKKGIRFVLSSGRTRKSICHMFREIEHDIIIIAENGAHVSYRGENLLLKFMDKTYVNDLVRELRTYRPECELLVSTLRGSLIEEGNEKFTRYIESHYKNNIIVVKDITKEAEEILKVSIYCPGTIRSLGETKLIPRWQDKVKACMAGEEWVDFMDQSVDKGNALKFLQEYYQIGREETMVFGDNSNDIGLMKAADQSYAVENAVLEVKEAANYICPSYHEKGVYQVLKALV